MSKLRILVAEDERHIREGLIDVLDAEGYEGIGAADGLEALRLAQSQEFDLVLLDIMMPGKSGYDVCRELRKRSVHLPIIMVTAKGEEVDKVVGLELGADDYVTKPFGVHELLARIQAVLRRARRENLEEPRESALPDVFPFGAATVDRKRYEVRFGKHTHAVTAREMQLLEMLASHPDEVLSRETLLNEVWGVDYFGTTRTLDQHIAQLRKKVERNPAAPATILTVHGVGYRYNPAKD